MYVELFSNYNAIYTFFDPIGINVPIRLFSCE